MPAKPTSRRPFCSAITDTLKRTSGRASAASVPSLVAMSTSSKDEETEAMTCTMRGSMRRVSRSTRSSQLTLSSSDSEPTGSCGR